MDPSSQKQEERLEVAIRAAWLYYVASNTQQEIGHKLQVSRPTVQRLLALAVDRGLVNVRINHGITSCLELAAALRRRFNLTHCDVVPVNGDSADQVLSKIAIAGAQAMESYLSGAESAIIAVSSGQTIKAAIGKVKVFSRPDHRLVSLVGTIAPDGSSNPYDAALQAAEKIGAKCFLLPAPLLADSPQERAHWRRHHLYKVVEELAMQADAAFVGIGDMRIGGPMHRDGFITEAEMVELIEAGAVGDNLGWAFGRQGDPVRTASQQRVTSVQLPRPYEKPVIALAGGERKAEAVLGALRGRWVNGLVTDEMCARSIIAMEAKEAAKT